MSDLYLSVTIIGILVVFAVLFGFFVFSFIDKQEENRIVDEISLKVLSGDIRPDLVENYLYRDYGHVCLRSNDTKENLTKAIYKKVLESFEPFVVQLPLDHLCSFFVSCGLDDFAPLTADREKDFYLIDGHIVYFSEDLSQVICICSLQWYQKEVDDFQNKERQNLRYMLEEIEKMAQIVEDSNKEAQNPHTHPNPTLEYTYSVEVRKKESPKKPSKKSKVAKNTTKKKVSKAPPKKTKTLSKKSASKKVTKKTSK